MKVAIISDIHGNQYALNAVLRAAKAIKIQKILVLGDIVGYYYHPELVLNMLSEWDFEIIKGNHEIILQDLKENKVDKIDLIKKYGSGHIQALKNLDDYTLNWLFKLPVQKSISIDSVLFQLNHGSPFFVDQYLYPNSPINVLENCNSNFHDFVLVGHSHYSFTYKCSNSILINCGSIGQSRQKSGVAYWAVVDTFNKGYEIKTTLYDTSKLLQEVIFFDSQNEYNYKILKR